MQRLNKCLLALQVSYSLAELDPNRDDSKTFAVRADGRLVVAKHLDYETRSSHEFWLIAHDDGSPRLSSQIPVKVRAL